MEARGRRPESFPRISLASGLRQRPAFCLVDKAVGHLHAFQGALAKIRRHTVGMVFQGKGAAQPPVVHRAGLGETKLDRDRLWFDGKRFDPGLGNCRLCDVDVVEQCFQLGLYAFAGLAIFGGGRFIRDLDAAGMQFLRNSKIVERDDRPWTRFDRLFRCHKQVVEQGREIAVCARDSLPALDTRWSTMWTLVVLR